MTFILTNRNLALYCLSMKYEDKKILLLSCCAPCSCAVIQKLKEDGANFAVLFYNPNIHPEAEYIKRRDEQKNLCQKWDIEFIELPYNPEDWLKMATPYKDEPERGKRCAECFKYRLNRAMAYAKEHGFTHVSSVLGVSRWKDLSQVNKAGFESSQQAGIPYLEIEGRKGGMQELRARLIKELNLYNQTYCGCIFSQKH